MEGVLQEATQEQSQILRMITPDLAKIAVECWQRAG